MPVRNERVCSQSTTWPSLVCDAEQRAKKSAPTDRGAFRKLCWKLLGLLPLFGSSLLVSLLHLLRHRDLLLSVCCPKQSWWDCVKPAIPSLALLLRMSSASVKKNPEYSSARLGGGSDLLRNAAVISLARGDVQAFALNAHFDGVIAQPWTALRGVIQRVLVASLVRNLRIKILE